MSAAATPSRSSASQPAPLPAGVRVAAVVSRYNEPVTRRMLEGASHALAAAGLADGAIDVAWVPGAFELPLAADRMAATGRYAAVLCLGAIIKGETSHDRHIASAVASGIEQVGRSHGLPVLFGVLTCDTLAQAMARAGGTAADGFTGNKGVECATAAVEMIGLLRTLPAADSRP
ncbi:MAG: 6,7-dimethyl-8-ribityllumazine synthase [Planctomycetia bacterium]